MEMDFSKTTATGFAELLAVLAAKGVLLPPDVDRLEHAMLNQLPDFDSEERRANAIAEFKRFFDGLRSV